MLHLNHISKRFGDRYIINDVSLTVERGEIAVLLGSSGVGKSTLLRVLNNLESLDAGSVLLDGKPLDLTTVNRTNTIGMLFQNFNLFENLTVEQNITLALEKVRKLLPAQAKEIAQALLEQYGLRAKSNAPVTALSGGQKQRLALARALALRPQILCLDEPTSALDPLLTTQVANNITELAASGYTILVATHDTLLLEKMACTIYLMESGIIVEKAFSDDFARNKAAYPRLANFVAGTL
ncbi:amino acid ABC transporter ATP-binding protein [Candidatus Dependentiae bacterium]|nr:amino acid ABC transporter ATP-binding protein [Candidatus Dependentiae bacterium]MCC7415419.1 amino acid ABC transporter ATP-binding protein [Campylobacterota bacterium]